MRPSEWAAHASKGVRPRTKEELLVRLTVVLEGPVKRNTRVRTGRLRNSWHRRVDASGDRASVATNVVYGPFVDARFPILEPALAESMPQVEREVRAFGGQVLKEMR